VEPWGGGEHEFTVIAMRACASCSCDVITTVYRLGVVIATPRIELSAFRCNAGLIEIYVAKPPTFIEISAFHNL
jgi:hypothetical protein